MFDAHNHFTNINSIICTSELLPQNSINGFDISKVLTSEIGLDRRFEDLISLEKQILNLKMALNYAQDNKIPVVIHCVQRTEITIKILKEFNLDAHSVLWHGFNGSIETAKELNKLGILISISPKYNKSIKDLYSNTDNSLIESDYEGNSDKEHSQIILEMYNKVSKETGIAIKELEENAINATKAFKSRITFR